LYEWDGFTLPFEITDHGSVKIFKIIFQPYPKLMNTLNVADWIPSPNLYTHAGTLVSEGVQDIEFFAIPPAEIGEIQSVSSTLRRSQQPQPAFVKIGLSLLVLLISLALAIFLWEASPVFSICGLGVGIGLALIAYASLDFNHRCSFVGTEGIAYYTLKGSRTASVKATYLMFREVGDLFTQQTSNYVNGVYTGTDYQYNFTRPQNQPHKISGTYRDNKKWTPSNDQWFLAHAAERAWTSYFLNYVNQQFDQVGYVEFAMAGNPKAVRVGHGYLEFISKDDSTAYVAVADMKKISLNSGIFYFEHKDSTWWKGKGKYSFAYGSLPNARAFLICLDQVAGIQWS
jgi:hypothetical protein